MLLTSCLAWSLSILSYLTMLSAFEVLVMAHAEACCADGACLSGGR